MSVKEPGLPKYQIVKDYVLAQIENQEISKDDRIPSESEFSKMLNVSSITVRKALSELVNEGVIYRVRGKGSFVAASQPSVSEKASNLVAFVISGVEMYDSSYMQIMKGIQSFLGKHDCKLIIEFVENNFEEERDLICVCFSLILEEYSFTLPIRLPRKAILMIFERNRFLLLCLTVRLPGIRLTWSLATIMTAPTRRWNI
ncbi:hypothetical protein MU1_10420 [Paenibacillus glycanilyticus]|uniref:HTH gntR-type domain-containing protein n=1 Tax=Paenibacillus glycanilyticus TaxID=126569 RepID=A0ABQ6G8W7_9BACL|nr:hypothetical protein MU1_10420 [Paenibacillus glycanilyticus]